MPDARTLLPIAGPLAIAGLLAVVSTLSDDETPSPEPLAYPEHPPGPARPATAEPSRTEAPPVAAIDRPRCLAQMSIRELSRQLMRLPQAQAIAELYRDEATPEVARAYHQALADAAATLAPGVARSRLLTIAADGLVRLDAPEPARVALQASRDVPPPQPNDFGFDRTDWLEQAAAVAARLDDHALALSLVQDDPEARAALARHYAEAGDASRARPLLEAADAATEPPDYDLGVHRQQAPALAALGDVDQALALADRSSIDGALVRLDIARTLLARSQAERAVEILRTTADSIPDTMEWFRRLALLVGIARSLHDAGQPEAAAALRDRVRTELRARGDHFQALSLWPALIEATHRAGQAEQAWDDLAALERLSLSNVAVAPMSRVLLLVEEDRLADALTVIHETAAMPYPLAYARVHARLRPPAPAVEAELDRGLRMFCD